MLGSPDMPHSLKRWSISTCQSFLDKGNCKWKSLSLCRVIIDNSCTHNLISDVSAKKLGLTLQNHPKPYTVGWIGNGDAVRITQMCQVPISIGKCCKDTILCDVVQMDATHILLVVHGNSTLMQLIRATLTSTLSELMIVTSCWCNYHQMTRQHTDKPNLILQSRTRLSIGGQWRFKWRESNTTNMYTATHGKFSNYHYKSASYIAILMNSWSQNWLLIRSFITQSGTISIESQGSQYSTGTGRTIVGRWSNHTKYQSLCSAWWPYLSWRRMEIDECASTAVRSKGSQINTASWFPALRNYLMPWQELSSFPSLI